MYIFLWIQYGCLANRICTLDLTLQEHAYSNILKSLQSKKGNFSDKKFRYFSYFCSKHIYRLWVLIRTALARQFWWVPTIYVFRKIRNNVYPVHPSFTTQKWGLRGSKLYRHVFVMQDGNTYVIKGLWCTFWCKHKNSFRTLGIVCGGG